MAASDLTDTQRGRIRQFYARHHEAWTFVHRAGYVDEIWPGGLYPSQSEARAALRAAYDHDELEQAKPDVAHWDADGEFWSYDH